MKTFLIITGIAMAALNIGFIAWAVARYIACCSKQKEETLDHHKNKFLK